MARQTTKRTVRFARQLRREMSLPEVLLWQLLRKSDVKFRRQHPCGRYVADFYCPAAKVVIEIEGIVHDMGEHPQRDEVRTRWQEEQGYTVLRIAAREVLKDVGAVAESLAGYCRARCA